MHAAARMDAMNKPLYVACAALGLLGAGLGSAVAEVQVPGVAADRMLYDPRAQSEMDVLVSPEEMAAFTADTQAAAVLFVEDRALSIRWAKALPKRWLNNLPAHAGTFRGTAQPGEFYVFQIGAFAAQRELARLSITFGDLSGPAGSIKGTELRCFNLGGINNQGQAFTKDVNVARGKLQALWIGIAVPRSRDCNS